MPSPSVSSTESDYAASLRPSVREDKSKEGRPSSKGSVGSYILSQRSLQVNVPSEVRNSEPNRLWALIIGINDYTHPTANLERLKGAVPDADAMDDYVRNKLGVPAHIINLRDEKATHDKIIEGFNSLREDTLGIQFGDPILIYFAGHGAEVRSESRGTIQALVPVDYETGNAKASPIPDYTVAGLIDGIAQKHGNNITVILDCCYSGSGTRGEDKSDLETIVRACELDPNDIPVNLDADIRKSYQDSSDTRGMHFSEGFAMKGMKSHVLLAACSANEKAREDRSMEIPGNRGRFTTALLKLLWSVHPDQITYTEVLKRIPRIDGQNPQCEGFHNDRFLFNRKVRPRSRRIYEVEFRTADKAHVLQGGRAHGIIDGAEFTLYNETDVALVGKPLGVMVASGKGIKPFVTILEPADPTTPPLRTNAIAIQTKVGIKEDLPIHVPPDKQYMPVFEAIALEMSRTDREPYWIKVVDKDQAKLEIALHEEHENYVTFNVLEETARSYGFTRMPQMVELRAEDLGEVLRAAAHYHVHLDIDSGNTKIRIGEQIKFSFFPLERGFEDDGETAVYTPPQGMNKNMLHNGIIEFEVDEEVDYGMEIINNSPWDLYFEGFFFDHADFSIRPLTQIDPETWHDKDYNLGGGKVVGIGYGPSGIPPINCDVPQGLAVTIGFLKFYFTSKLIDLSHIPQGSPFAPGRGMKTSSRRPPPVGKDQTVWGTVRIPVIQKRMK